MRTIDANWVVGLEGIGDAGGGQKGDDDGDHNKQGQEHRNATSTGGTPGVNDLGTKTSKEHQKEVDGQNAGKEKGSDGEGLHKLDDAEDGLVARVSSSNIGLLAVKVCFGGPLLKVPSNISAVVEKSI